MNSSDLRLIGIDLGTSGLRTVAYDEEGNVVERGEATVSDQSQDEWERALKEGSVDLGSEEKICSVDSTSGTIVMVDEYGDMVFPPQMYHESAPSYSEEIESCEPAEEAREKGISISSTSPLPKIMRIRDENPDKFKKVEWILSPTTWLLYRLRYEKGERWRELETDWTNALKFGADITVDEPCWFEPLFEEADVPLDLFPEVRGPGTPVGSAESDFAEMVNLDGASLYQGLSDGNASALAMGCLKPGDYGIACGSTSIPKLVAESIKPDEAIYYHRHPIEGYLAGAAFETGIVLRWFCEKVLEINQRKALELARKIDMGKEYGFYPQGDRSPFFDPSLGNTLSDFHPNQDLSPDEVKGRFIRGIVTGIALEEYQYIPLFEDLFDRAIERVYFLGGGTPGGDDPFTWWNELRASIWDREVIKMEPRTTVGSLVPATLSASIYDNLEEVNEYLLREESTISRSDQIASEYKEKKENFLEKWEKIRDLSPLF